MEKRNRVSQFKTNLTSFYVYEKYKGIMSPCERYGIDEETWKEFVKIREDPSWEVCTVSSLFLNPSLKFITNFSYFYLTGKEEEGPRHSTKECHPTLPV